MNLIKRHLVLIDLPVDAEDPQNTLKTQISQLLEEAEAEAKSIVEKARQEASEILQQAAKEAERLRQEAEDEAERLRREAGDRGYREGVSKAKELKTLLHRIVQHYHEHLQELEKNALPILLEVFELVSLKLFGREFDEHEKMLKISLERALEKLRTTADVIVRVNKQDYEEFGEEIEKILSFGKMIHLKPDAGIKRSEVLVETDYGVIESSPRRILEEFTNHLRELKDAVSSEAEAIQGESGAD
ncbi:MAG: hypothetical protein J7J80_02920 [Thermotogae bacterium]|nr:hypothetical protein [Thermotogota bacterium]